MAAPAIALHVLAGTGFAELARFPVLPEFTVARRAIVAAVTAIAVVSVAVAEIPLARPAELARLLAFALVIAVRRLPQRALRLQIDDVGLRPMTGRDEILLLRPVGLVVLDVLTERPPNAARRTVLLGEALRRCDDPQIMLGMLVIVFGHHRVARRLRIARQL